MVGERVMKRIAGIHVIVIAVAFMSLSVAAAQEVQKEKPWERLNFNIGGFVTTLNSEFRIGSASLGTGLEVNMEDALGLDSSLFVFRVDGMYRFTDNRRHRFDLTYFDLRRTATKTLQKDIQMGDQTFTAGTTLDSLFDLKIIKGAYSYSLFQDDRFDLGLSVGVYVAPIKIRLSSLRTGDAQEENITAPLPVLGLRFDYAITPKFFLKQNIDFFYMEYEKYKGSLLDAKVALEYNIWKHVGIGAAYEYLQVQVKSEGNNYPGIDMVGKIQFSYGGLMLYGKIYF
jgi:hypothetical protein